ncbi:MAG: hypothetical protein M1833_006958 [Piccolia ochrophora]|nr:MAG: hypothetical protein M1833_006958 [Piccolia ochrophora]
MFAVLPAGRPVHTALTVIDPTHYTLSLVPTPHFNHLAIFFLPDTTLPPSTAAAVYIRLPGQTEFKLLGAIGEGKESCILSIKDVGGGGTQSGSGGDDDLMVDDAVGAPSGPARVLEVGISIEDAASVQAQLAVVKGGGAPGPVGGTTSMALVKPPAGPPPTKVLAQRIIQNAFNFLASFAEKGKGQSGAGEEVVPLKSFREWWAKFERRIERDPGFLERDEQ